MGVGTKNFEVPGVPTADGTEYFNGVIHGTHIIVGVPTPSIGVPVSVSYPGRLYVLRMRRCCGCFRVFERSHSNGGQSAFGEESFDSIAHGANSIFFINSATGSRRRLFAL